MAGGADAEESVSRVRTVWSLEPGVPKQSAGSLGGEGEAGFFPIRAEQADGCRGRG